LAFLAAAFGVDGFAEDAALAAVFTLAAALVFVAVWFLLLFLLLMFSGDFTDDFLRLSAPPADFPAADGLAEVKAVLAVAAFLRGADSLVLSVFAAFGFAAVEIFFAAPVAFTV